MSDPANYRRASFDSVSALPDEDRQARLEAVLRQAKVRIPVRKATQLAYNHPLILDAGGLAAIQATARGLVGSHAKIAFLKQFKGIGDKYSRNIWMDMYDSDFRCAVALDERIRSISSVLGIDDLSYAEHEAAYQTIARDAGIEAWELDRILYWYTPEVRAFIQERTR